MSFSSFGLSEALLRALVDKGYSTPTPIQLKAIPAGLTGQDIMVAAQTGTGKTACYALPLLQRLACGVGVKANHVRALVLTPTRELAVQVAESVAAYGRHLSLKSAVVYGGVKINPQMMKLRGGIDILVATPGRLLDLSNRNAVKFSQVEMLVLDEADRMLDLGFIGDIKKILAALPGKRQNMLFSATFSADIRALVGGLLHQPVLITAGPQNSAARSVRQVVYEVDKGKKPALLSRLIRQKSGEQTLVFVRTRDDADRLARRLGDEGIAAAALHGDKTQGERTRVLADFKANTIRVLVATDIAARGIDICQLPRVINFVLPKVPEDYIHRIGRTGRAGSGGEAISLVSADEVGLLAAIEGLIRQTLVREVEAGFIPSHTVPLTRLMQVRPKKPKKPKPVWKDKAQGRKTAGAENPGGTKARRGGRPRDTDTEAPATSGSQRLRRGTAKKR
jgi:ATP-dependent RNA helicase RhlE